MINKTETTC